MSKVTVTKTQSVEIIYGHLGYLEMHTFPIVCVGIYSACSCLHVRVSLRVSL